MNPLEQKALDFATRAHGAIDQRRKYTNTPYIEHPIAVAEMVRQSAGSTSDMVAAAYLHDVVEDTSTTLDEIRLEFGSTIARLVAELTEHQTTGNRAVRKDAECARLATISDKAQTIKLADLIDNTGSIVERDPKFAVVYLAEKSALLDVLTRGCPALRALARRVLWESKVLLAIT